MSDFYYALDGWLGRTVMEGIEAQMEQEALKKHIQAIIGGIIRYREGGDYRQATKASCKAIRCNCKHS